MCCRSSLHSIINTDTVLQNVSQEILQHHQMMRTPLMSMNILFAFSFTVNGMPNLESDPNELSGKDTPISDIDIPLIDIPVIAPRNPGNPTVANV